MFSLQALVRDNIVSAVVQAPEVIRIQLSVCISMIIKHDFPHKWPQVVDQISIHLDTGVDNWLGKFYLSSFDYELDNFRSFFFNFDPFSKK